MTDVKRRRLGVVLFPVFELLDVFGPLEMFGILSDRVEIVVAAERPGPVTSAQGPEVVAHHAPSPSRDPGRRRRTELRAQLVTAWSRLPTPLAVRVSVRGLRPPAWPSFCSLPSDMQSCCQS